MLSKTRTTIISLVAAISFSGAAIVPTVAQADTKRTTGKQQAEKNCEADFKGFEASVNRMEQTQKEGNSAGFNDAKRTAENFLTLYESAGCDTILGRRLPPLPGHRVLPTRLRSQADLLTPLVRSGSTKPGAGRKPPPTRGLSAAC